MEAKKTRDRTAKGTLTRPFRSNQEFLDAYVELLKSLCKLKLEQDQVEEARQKAALESLSADTLKRAQVPDLSPELIGKYERASSRFRARIQATLALERTRLPLIRLTSRFGLSELEEAVLVTCIAYTSILSFEQQMDQVTLCGRQSIKAILRLLCYEQRDIQRQRTVFMPGSKLVRNGLLSIGTRRNWNALSEEDFLALTPEVPLRISNMILGQGFNDGIEDGCLALVNPTKSLTDPMLEAETQEELLRIADAEREAERQFLLNGPAEDEPRILLLYGPPGSGKRRAARLLAAMLGKKLLLIRTPRYLRNEYEEPDDLARTLSMAEVNDAIPCFFSATEILDDDPDLAFPEVFADAFSRFPGLVILTSTHTPRLGGALGRCVTHLIGLSLPSREKKIMAIEKAIPASFPRAADLDLGRVADRMNDHLTRVRRLTRSACLRASARKGQDRELRHCDFFPSILVEGAGSNTDPDRPSYLTTPKAGLRDLVLPDALFGQIRQIVEAASLQDTVYREWGLAETYSAGRGISALFYGPSGTGKTLAAEAIASELGRPLRIVQQSGMMDKYVGETEKHTAEVFRTASSNGEVLVIDEADALFAARVSGSQDGSYYINSHINTLLREMESFSGVLILTSNRALEMDQAFERRIRWKLAFPLPDRAIREKLWRQLIPPRVPLASDVDFGALAAEFDFAGGSIRSAILKAAFSAAASREPISMGNLRDAALSERLINETDSTKARIGFPSLA